jgi:anti-sigma factor RsiW
MSRCGRAGKIEAAVMGELPVAQSQELLAHAEHCASCRTEKSWLETEKAFFRQRAVRDEVQKLWAGVEQRSGAGASQRQRRWSGFALAVAASLLFVLGISGRMLESPAGTASAELNPAMSFEIMSADFQTGRGSDDPPCTRLKPGFGFRCEGLELASR